MKALLISALVASFSMTTHALEGLTDSQNIHGTLIEWFEQGDDLTYEAAEGFYSGRCYKVEKPNEPRNSLLAIYQKTVDYGHGPAFPANVERKMIHVYRRDSTPDYYDSMTASDAMRQSDQFWSVASLLADTSPTLTALSANDPIQRTVQTKVYEDYFISLITDQTLGDEANQSITHSFACYYFTQLQ